jgi:F420-non-reducing hydrogenase iron-sulfur subunit
LLKKYINQMGIHPDRLRLEWISASEGKQFAELADEMTEAMINLGPAKINEVMQIA